VDNFPEKVSFIWSVADLLRGDYKQSEYGRVILPLVVLRRLDCVLEPTKARVLAKHAELTGRVDNVGPILDKITGHKDLYNTSKFDLPKLLDDPNHVADNLRAYVAAFSPVARDVMHRFGFDVQIDRLDRSKLLYLVVSRFCDIDLHPDVVSNTEMGYIYEELIRRFSEQSNETAGEHFTPREVIRLMVNLLFVGEEDVLAKPGIVKTLFDPACGTGGMLSVAEEWLRELNPNAELRVFGQELNDETYATCRADMMLKGQDAASIHAGNSFTEDGLAGQTFDYMLANPPFGVEWKKVADEVRREHETLGFSGRFGAGLPRINDGSLLFLQHMLSKMKPVAQGGSRLAIVFNGSPLFTGAAGSGESEIRRWIIENDWLEAVVALPDQLFYNTGISTYFWVLTNHKSIQRRGKVQLVDARDFWIKMRKSLGEKRKQTSDDQIREITQLYASFSDGEQSKTFPIEAFGYQRITVERPLRARWAVNDDALAAVAATNAVVKLDDDQRAKLTDALTRAGDRVAIGETEARAAVSEALSDVGVKGKAAATAVLDALMMRDESAAVVTDSKGKALPDPDLRDQENVPLPPVTSTFAPEVADRLASDPYREAVESYVEVEVLPFVHDAWIDHTKTKIGYEIPLTRHFYKYGPPRPLEEIDAEIKALEAEIQALLREVTG
jgi:type I restriction enzyme M protein